MHGIPGKDDEDTDDQEQQELSLPLAHSLSLYLYMYICPGAHEERLCLGPGYTREKR